jgi:hypothetical protein
MIPSNPDGVPRLFRHRPEPRGGDRFFEEIEGPLLHRLHRLGNGGVAGDHDHLRLGKRLLRAAENLHPVQAVHHQVGDDDVENFGVEPLGPLRPAFGDGALVAHPLQSLGHGVGVVGVVIDQQHAQRGRGGRGRVVLK